MDFLLTGLARTHKVYDDIVDISDCRDFVLRRFLYEKRDREPANNELEKNCSRFTLDSALSPLRRFLLLMAKTNDVQDKVYLAMKD